MQNTVAARHNGSRAHRSSCQCHRLSSITDALP